MIDGAFTRDEIDKKLQDYLQANGLRQTKERFAILHAAYNQKSTFTIEDLQNVLTLQRFHVSTATLYTATQLLVQANLLIRHPFSSSTAIFERIADDKPKCYQICNRCHQITRIKSKEVAFAVNSYRPRRFNVHCRVMYIYGTCPKCERAMRKFLRQLENNIKTE